MAPKWFDHWTTWAGRVSGEGDGLASSGKKVEFSLSPIWGTGGVIRGRWTALLAPTHTSCLKNVPPLTCYNLDIHGLITIIFGRSFTEKIINKSDDALFSHLTYLVLQQKRKPRRQRTGVLCMQHSPTAASLSTSFLLNHAPPNSPRAERMITRFRESYRSVWVVSQKDWRNQGANGWILAMH